MFNLENVFGKKAKKAMMTKEEIAEFIKTNPEALRSFEESYTKHVKNKLSNNFFAVNAKQAVSEKCFLSDLAAENVHLDALVQRIVAELLDSAAVYVWDGADDHVQTFDSLPENYVPVSNEDLKSVPEGYRPELTGYLYKRDIGEAASGMLLSVYKDFLLCKDPKKKMQLYGMFRQGLDIQDLDPITYKIIDRNRNSMGYWLPPLVQAVKQQDFFKIPQTKVLKVPLPLLQLTRMEYMSLNPSTLCIVDEFCQKAFGLDPEKEYFIKTGTYSSKFDFRNAHVLGEKEVRELGEYLLFIHFQALCMAHYDLSGRNQPCIYGVSTTTEWVVREYIQPKPGAKEIYFGLPLRPEYRIFVDFDSDRILGCSPYWEPEMMKKRFGHSADSTKPDKVHDYISYSAAEEELMEQYRKNIGKVKENLKRMLPEIGLTGQWSMDVMQNGNDFYLIDIALAENSALKECVPKSLLKKVEEDWIPRINTNPHILELLKIIEKEWDKRFPLSFITNGRKLADTPDIFEAVQDMQKKYGKKKIMIQVTDDPRFYPQPFSEKQKYRLKKLDAVIEGVPGNGNKCLYPQGRTLENFDDSWWNTIAPKCVNVRLLAKQGVDSIRGIVNTLFRAGKVCTPSISPAGEIKLGESALCPSVASIYDTEQEIIEKIQRCRCQSCEYSWQQLKNTSIRAFEVLTKN